MKFVLGLIGCSLLALRIVLGMEPPALAGNESDFVTRLGKYVPVHAILSIMLASAFWCGGMGIQRWSHQLEWTATKEVLKVVFPYAVLYYILILIQESNVAGMSVNNSFLVEKKINLVTNPFALPAISKLQSPLKLLSIIKTHVIVSTVLQLFPGSIERAKWYIKLITLVGWTWGMIFSFQFQGSTLMVRNLDKLNLGSFVSDASLLIFLSRRWLINHQIQSKSIWICLGFSGVVALWIICAFTDLNQLHLFDLVLLTLETNLVIVYFCDQLDRSWEPDHRTVSVEI